VYLVGFYYKNTRAAIMLKRNRIYRCRKITWP